MLTVKIDIKDFKQKTKILMHFYLNYLHKIKIGCIWAETQPLTLIFVWALWIYCHRLTLKVCPTKLSKNCLWILVRLDQSEVSIMTLSTNHSSPGHTPGGSGTCSAAAPPSPLQGRYFIHLITSSLSIMDFSISSSSFNILWKYEGARANNYTF